MRCDVKITIGQAQSNHWGAGGGGKLILNSAFPRSLLPLAAVVGFVLVIMIATALHSIATGNMLPSYVHDEARDEIRPLTTICVDSSEFVVSKLKDRGTHQAFGVVTNAQDFMHILRLYVERELDARKNAPQPAAAAR